jgi:TDG/mug DNA glycosylase family protein
MKTVQVNLRLEPDLIRKLQAAADAESLERGTMMRKLLIQALSGWRLDHALRRYQAGDISIGRACEESGRSHWEMIELAQARGIAYRIDVDDALDRARSIMSKRRERVAEDAPGYAAAGGSPDKSGSAGIARRGGRTPRAPRRAKRASDDTLPDFPPQPGAVLLVGINPSPPSVARGHYYQGRLGRRLWKRLDSVGLLTDAVPGQEDEALVAAGHGLTDLVKRVTASASELSATELRAGGEALHARVVEWRPALVVFVFKEAAVHVLGRRDIAPGRCGEIAGAQTFLLPGPYARKDEADRVYEELRQLLA